MRTFTSGLTRFTIAAVALATAEAHAQPCDPSWDHAFADPGADGAVRALAVDDEGALYAAGAFRTIGDAPADRVARLGGESWTPLAGGVDGIAGALATHNGDLWVGGSFTVADVVVARRVAVWDGDEWSEPGQGFDGPVAGLRVHDGQMHAAGSFVTAGGSTARSVARWNGSSWQALANGLTGPAFALGETPNGDLVGGGDFGAALGGPLASNVVRWDGAQFHAMGDGLDGPVRALALHDDGSGEALYAGGDFTGRVARWDGATWTPVGGALDGPVHTLAAHDDGSGPALYAGGAFNDPADPTTPANLARYDGDSWSIVLDGLTASTLAPSVEALAGADAGLVIGGAFQTTGAGAAANNVARAEGCAATDPSPDLNDDGRVGSGDLALLIAAWGATGPADLNGDGRVGSGDLAILISAWG